MVADFDAEEHLRYQAAIRMYDLAEDKRLPLNPILGKQLFLRAFEGTPIVVCASDAKQQLTFGLSGEEYSVTLGYHEIGNPGSHFTRWSIQAFKQDFSSVVDSLSFSFSDNKRVDFVRSLNRRFSHIIWEEMKARLDTLFSFNYKKPQSIFKDTLAVFPLAFYQKVIEFGDCKNAAGMTALEVHEKSDDITLLETPHNRLPSTSDMHDYFLGLYTSRLIVHFGLETRNEWDSLSELEGLCLCDDKLDFIKTCFSEKEELAYEQEIQTPKKDLKTKDIE